MLKNIFVKVVGVTFSNPDGSSRQEVVAQIKPEDFVELRREYNNPYDPMAISVFFNDKQVGYIGKEDGELLVVLMDSGSKLVSVAKKVGFYEGKYYLHLLISEKVEEMNDGSLL